MEGGDGGDINNLTVTGYNTIFVELTGIVFVWKFCHGRPSKAVSAHVVVVLSLAVVITKL